jgi:hypothetical protein
LSSFSLDVFSPSKPLIKVEAEILCFCGCRYLHVVHCYPVKFYGKKVKYAMAVSFNVFPINYS